MSLSASKAGSTSSQPTDSRKLKLIGACCILLSEASALHAFQSTRIQVFGWEMCPDMQAQRTETSTLGLESCRCMIRSEGLQPKFPLYDAPDVTILRLKDKKGAARVCCSC